MGAHDELMFGMAALKMGLATRRQLLDAVAAWLDERDAKGDRARGIEARLRDVANLDDGDSASVPEAIAPAPDIEPDLRESLLAMRPPREIRTWLKALPDRSGPVAPLPRGERYALGLEVARGGLGQALEATDRELGPEVAIKTLHDGAGEEPTARFVREAKEMGRAVESRVSRVEHEERGARPAEETALTLVGDVVGTPAYMPPEQASGGAGLDQRADIYALGGILYAILMWRPPFEGTISMAALKKVKTEPLRPPSERIAGLPGPSPCRPSSRRSACAPSRPFPPTGTPQRSTCTATSSCFSKACGSASVRRRWRGTGRRRGGESWRVTGSCARRSGRSKSAWRIWRGVSGGGGRRRRSGRYGRCRRGGARWRRRGSGRTRGRRRRSGRRWWRRATARTRGRGGASFWPTGVSRQRRAGRRPARCSPGTCLPSTTARGGTARGWTRLAAWRCGRSGGAAAVSRPRVRRGGAFPWTSRRCARGATGGRVPTCPSRTATARCPRRACGPARGRAGIRRRARATRWPGRRSGSGGWSRATAGSSRSRRSARSRRRSRGSRSRRDRGRARSARPASSRRGSRSGSGATSCANAT